MVGRVDRREGNLVKTVRLRIRRVDALVVLDHPVLQRLPHLGSIARRQLRGEFMARRLVFGTLARRRHSARVGRSGRGSDTGAVEDSVGFVHLTVVLLDGRPGF